MNRGPLLLALLSAALLPPAAPPAAAAAAETRSSAHYTWNIHGDCPEVPELMKVAEQAWGRFAAYFGGKPGGKLEIEYFEKASDYTSILTGKGAGESGGVPAQGRFYGEDKKVYQPRMERPYETRQWLIANLATQFTYLGVYSKGKNPPGWYRAGIVFHFAVHRWDGKTLEVAVDDDPGGVGSSLAQFASDAKEGKWDPMDAVNSDSNVYVEGLAAVRFLLSGADKTATARFKALERKMWEGMEAREAATALLGSDPKKIRKSAKDWILGLQRSWTPLSDLWERTSEDSFNGEPFNKGQDAFLLHEADAGPAPFIEATIVPAEKGEGGLVFGFSDAVGGYVVVWSPSAKVELLRKSGRERGTVMASAEGPPGAEAKLRVEVDGLVVKVLVGGKEAFTWTVGDRDAPAKGRTGLLCSGGRVRFTGVKCSEVKPKK